jgi:hypothetical protein
MFILEFTQQCLSHHVDTQAVDSDVQFNFSSIRGAPSRQWQLVPERLAARLLNMRPQQLEDLLEGVELRPRAIEIM